MNHPSTDFRQFLLERIALEDEHFAQASQMSQQVTGEAHQWQTYLHGLALFGFEKWLQERMAVSINRENCSLVQPETANVITAACNYQVGEFNCCLIATESLLAEMVSVPQAVVELPEFVAHFYIAIEVLEEQGEAIIRGFLPYDRLIARLRSSHLTITDDWHYLLPWEWFDSEPDRLLVNLRYLQPRGIPLPVPLAASVVRSSLMESERESLLMRLRSPEQKLWHNLTWHQGAAFIADFTFLNLLYQWQTRPERDALLAIRMREVLTLLTARTLNTALWLRGELDEWAQSLGLFTRTASLLRSGNNNKLEQAIASLRNAGLEIPLEVSPIYQDLNLDDLPLRLCSVIWSPDPDLASRGKWSLLLILGTQLGHFLPSGIKLQVSNLKGRSVEATSEVEDLLLYTTIEGNWGEKFVVTLIADRGTPLILSPYTFNPI